MNGLEMEDSAMAQKKEALKRKRLKKAVPVLGAAGVLSLAGGAASAATIPTADLPSKGTTPPHQMFLGEEEVADVTLSKFFVFDKESAKTETGVKEAWWRGCGGCRGCRGCGWRGCGGCWWGCGWGCCASWGRCRYC